MMSRRGLHYPHVFLDVNALIRLARSLSHHRFDQKGRKSRIRVLMELGALRVATAEPLLSKALYIIETDPTVVGDTDPGILAEELQHATRAEWLVVITRGDADNLDEPRARIYNMLAPNWYHVLVDRDEEDAEMLTYAALAYAKFCLIRSRTMGSEPYYMPSYMLIVSDDDDVYSNRHILDIQLKGVLRSASQTGIRMGRYPKRKNLVSVAKWREFREYAKRLTGTA